MRDVEWRDTEKKKREQKKKKAGCLRCAPPRTCSLPPLFSPLSLFLKASPHPPPPISSLKAVAHAKGGSFSKRRGLLQGGGGGGDSSTSSSGAGGDSSASTSPFSNIVTVANDAPDRVEASPAVALAESPLSDAELCAVSKQVRRGRRERERRKEKKKRKKRDGGLFIVF